MISLEPIRAECPNCRSEEVFYTCHVQCCFNHVCNACHTTFELSTKLVNKDRLQVVEPEGARDTTLPTVPCVECGGHAVFQIEGTDKLYCLQCRSVLYLEYEKIVGTQ